MLSVYQTAVDYQMYHSLAVLVVAIVMMIYPADNRFFLYSARAFFFGLVLFCGSLYALVFSGLSFIGMITPIGGLAFIAGWLFLMLGFRQCMRFRPDIQEDNPS